MKSLVLALPVLLLSASASAASPRTHVVKTGAGCDGKLVYDPSLFELKVTRLNEIPDNPSIDQELGTLRLAQGGPAAYRVVHLSGPSCDPSFRLVPADAKSYLKAEDLPGETLDLASYPGRFILRQRYNRKAEVVRLFTYTEDEVREIPQPDHGMDLRSRALQDFVIYSEPGLKKRILEVRKGETVRVLVYRPEEKRDLFLVRTKDGITGWMQAETENESGKYRTQLEGIAHKGD